MTDIFLHGFESEFIYGLFNTSKKHFAQKFSFTYRYKDDVPSLKTKVSEFIDLIYACQLEIIDTTESKAHVSHS